MTSFDKLILVCGPSGGGKTTLLQLYRSGGLPDEIMGFFFPSADRWPVIDATNKMRRDIESEGPEAVAQRMNSPFGLFLHYDITSVLRSGLDGYGSDPALRLLNLARELQVIFVRPSQDTLLNQFTSRDATRRSRKSSVARLWNGVLLNRLRRVRARLTQRTWSSETQIYSDPAWIARCYSDWELYLEQLAQRTHSLCGVLRVEPSVEISGQPTFRVVPLAR